MHLADDQVERYRARALEPAELVRVDDHMAACNACRERIAAVAPPDPAIAHLRASLQREIGHDHLDYELLAGWVDDTLGEPEREIVASHVEVCEGCAAELRDLRAVARRLRRPYRAALAAAAILAAIAIAAGLASRSRPPASTGPADTPPLAGAPTPAPPPGARELLVDAGGPIDLDPVSIRTALAWLPSREAVVEAVASGRLLEPAVLATLRGRTGSLRGQLGSEPGFALLRPVGTVSRGRQPALEWSALAGAESYSVQVFDADYEPVATSPSLRATRWVVSSPLSPGAVYSWAVTARRAGEELRAPQPPLPEASFAVLDAAAERELRLAESREPRSHLALAVLYARAGLALDAERELRALAEANPGAPRAAALLHSLAAWSSR